MANIVEDDISLHNYCGSSFLFSKFCISCKYWIFSQNTGYKIKSVMICVLAVCFDYSAFANGSRWLFPFYFHPHITFTIAWFSCFMNSWNQCGTLVLGCRRTAVSNQTVDGRHQREHTLWTANVRIHTYWWADQVGRKASWKCHQWFHGLLQEHPGEEK